MLRYTVIFFIIALITTVLRFGGIAAGAASIAKILFMIFVVLFMVSLIWGLIAGRGWCRDDAHSFQPGSHDAMQLQEC